MFMTQWIKLDGRLVMQSLDMMSKGQKLKFWGLMIIATPIVLTVKGVKALKNKIVGTKDEGEYDG